MGARSTVSITPSWMMRHSCSPARAPSMDCLIAAATRPRPPRHYHTHESLLVRAGGYHTPFGCRGSRLMRGCGIMPRAWSRCRNGEDAARAWDIARERASSGALGLVPGVLTWTNWTVQLCRHSSDGLARTKTGPNERALGLSCRTLLHRRSRAAVAPLGEVRACAKLNGCPPNSVTNAGTDHAPCNTTQQKSPEMIACTPAAASSGEQTRHRQAWPAVSNCAEIVASFGHKRAHLPLQRPLLPTDLKSRCFSLVLLCSGSHCGYSLSQGLACRAARLCNRERLRAPLPRALVLMSACVTTSELVRDSHKVAAGRHVSGPVVAALPND